MWYAFEEQNDSNITHDFSQNSIDGTLSNAVRKFGKFGQSIALDGNSYIFSDAESLSLSSQLTISLWAKVLDDSQGVLVKIRSVLSAIF